MGGSPSARHNKQVNGHSTDSVPRPLGEARGWLARLTTVMRATEPPPGLTGRQVAADIAFAAAATAAALAMGALAARYPAGPAQVPMPGEGWQGWQAALPSVAIRTAPLAIRRFRPLTAFWLCLVVCMLT